MVDGRMTRRVLVLIIMLALVASAPGGLDAARGPDLRLRPNDGEAGETILARGKDFPAGASGSIVWEDVAEPVGAFTADDDGAFEVSITVPDVSAGTYVVTAVSGDQQAEDEFTVEAEEDAEGEPSSPVAAGPMPEWMAEAELPVEVEFAANSCEEPGTREVAVANGAELEAALADALPGDRITLADTTYTGNFVAEIDGSEAGRISLCGSRSAVIDGGGWEHSGYALHLLGDYWTVSGITVTDAQKGVMGDGVTGVVVDGVEVHTIGHEAVHFRTHSTDNVIQRSDIHDTGLDNEKFGEGVYLGTAVSNWGKYTDGEPDRSDRNQVLGNRIWNTTSESVDIKEGTEGGLVAGNLFDGSLLSGGDSWVDVKGNGYLLQGNVGNNSTQDGFQTHVIDNMEWGRDNLFEMNEATVNGPGVGFYIHQPEGRGNVVRCDNVVTGAEGGVTNLEEGCTEWVLSTVSSRSLPMGV
jgi:hypothetical protein